MSSRVAAAESLELLTADSLPSLEEQPPPRAPTHKSQSIAQAGAGCCGNVQAWLCALLFFGLGGLLFNLDRLLLKQPESAPDTPAIHTALANDIDDICRFRAVGGCEVVVADANGNAFFKHRTGQLARLSEQGLSTQLRIASTSKAVTAAVAARWLDSPQAKAVGWSFNTTLADVAAKDPNFASRVESYQTLRDNKKTIQLGMLLSHRGGFRHYNSNAEYLYNGSDPLELFGRDPLVSPPGTKYLYSSYGFHLAGLMLESMSGLSYEAVIEQTAHAMKLDTMVLAGSADFPAKQYTRSCIQITRSYKDTAKCELNDTYSSRAYDLAVAKKGPAGGLRATAKDLARFGALLVLSDSVLSPDNKAALFTGLSQVKENDWYGLGWHMNRQKDADEFWHSGGAVGGIAFVRVIKSQKMAMGFTCDTQYDGVILKDISDAVDAYFAPAFQGIGPAIFID